jgi:hypothetical protein
MLKAACHVHSDWSYDGRWSLERVAAEFARRRYQVLLMAEHDRGFSSERLARYRESCARASSEAILLIPGIEYSDRENMIHVLVWGPVPFLGEGRPTRSLLAAVHAAHGLAVLAHPSRRNVSQHFDFTLIRDLLGIEVWNRKTDGWAPNIAAWNLAEQMRLLPMVGMDFHDQKQLFPLAMEFADGVEAREGALLDSLRNHNCRPLVFGRPLKPTTRGWIGLTLQLAERCRKRAAAVYRSSRKKPSA